MKKKNLILSLAITLTVGLGATAYAASSSADTYRQGLGNGLGRIAGFKGSAIISSVLKSKGITDSEIANAVNSGKTIYTLAKEKGITDDELKKSLLEEKIKIIDDAVSKGTLTKEQGDASKAKITQNISNCTAPGQMTGKALGRQNKGRNMQKGTCLYNQVSTK